MRRLRFWGWWWSGLCAMGSVTCGGATAPFDVFGTFVDGGADASAGATGAGTGSTGSNQTATGPGGTTSSGAGGDGAGGAGTGQTGTGAAGTGTGTGQGGGTTTTGQGGGTTTTGLGGGAIGGRAGSGAAGAGGGTPADLCKLPMVSGPCDAFFPAWWHNPATGVCEPFIYGGCQGNANNFPSLAACQQACHGGMPDMDACEGPGSCILASAGCCGVCDTADARSFVAVNRAFSKAYPSARMCPPVACAPCPPVPEMQSTRQCFRGPGSRVMLPPA